MCKLMDRRVPRQTLERNISDSDSDSESMLRHASTIAPLSGPTGASLEGYLLTLSSLTSTFLPGQSRLTSAAMLLIVSRAAL